MMTLCTVVDDSIPGGLPFRGLVEFLDEYLSIVYVDVPTWSADTFTPYYSIADGSPVSYPDQAYSYRGIKLIHRLNKTFYVYGDRPRIKFTVNGPSEISLLTRQLTSYSQYKCVRQFHRRYRIFNRIPYAQLEKGLSKFALQVYNLVNHPTKKGTPPTMDFWMNDHFSAESLNPQGQGAFGEVAMRENLEAVRSFAMALVQAQMLAYFTHLYSVCRRWSGRQGPAIDGMKLYMSSLRNYILTLAEPAVKKEIQGKGSPSLEDEETKPKKKKNIFKRIGSSIRKKLSKLSKLGKNRRQS